MDRGSGDQREPVYGLAVRHQGRPREGLIATPKYWSENGTMLKVTLHDEFRPNVFEHMAAGEGAEPGTRSLVEKGHGQIRAQRPH